MSHERARQRPSRDAAPTFSVVIPTLNEAAWIGPTVRHLRHLDPQVEIVVADAGSDRLAGARTVEAPVGRGPQLRTGAAATRGEILLFLHADTQLPAGAFDLLRERFADPTVEVGTFRLRFDRDHWLLRTYALFTRLDSVLTRFGDQGIAIRRRFYDELGGFPNWPRLEDVHLLRLARRRTRVHSFPAQVTTSSRRFERDGIVRTQLRNAALLIGYLIGFLGRTA